MKSIGSKFTCQLVTCKLVTCQRATSREACGSGRFPKGESLAWVTLKPAGHLFYREHRVVYWNKIRSWIAIIIAVLSAIFSGVQAFKSDNSKVQENRLSHPKSSVTHQQKQPAKQWKVDKLDNSEIKVYSYFLDWSCAWAMGRKDKDDQFSSDR